MFSALILTLRFGCVALQYEQIGPFLGFSHGATDERPPGGVPWPLGSKLPLTSVLFYSTLVEPLTTLTGRTKQSLSFGVRSKRCDTSRVFSQGGLTVSITVPSLTCIFFFFRTWGSLWQIQLYFPDSDVRAPTDTPFLPFFRWRRRWQIWWAKRRKKSAG